MEGFTPTPAPDERIDALQCVIESTIDSAASLRQAADRIKSPGLSQILRVGSEMRRGTGTEMQSFLWSVGLEPRASGSLLGAVLRAYAGVRTAIVDDERVILAEPERAEACAKDHCERALTTWDEAPVREVLLAHYDGVSRMLARLQALRARPEASDSGDHAPPEHEIDDPAAGGPPHAPDRPLSHEGAPEPLPEVEDQYWQSHYLERPYVTRGSDYGMYRPAFRFGWEHAARNRGRTFEEMESELRGAWEAGRHALILSWDRAKTPVREAWDRAMSRSRL